MVLVTWRDGQNSKLQAVVVERRPCDFWKLRSKKRKLQKKSSGDSGTASENNSKDPPAPAGSLKTEIQLLGDGNAKLLGVSSSESELDGLKADQIDYYVHYVDHDR